MRPPVRELSNRSITVPAPVVDECLLAIHAQDRGWSSGGQT